MSISLGTNISYANGLFIGIHIMQIYLNHTTYLSCKKSFQKYKVMFKVFKETFQTNAWSDGNSVHITINSRKKNSKL